MTGTLFPDGASYDVRHGLFEPTVGYAGDNWAGEVLEPWLAAHRPILRALHRAGRPEMARRALRREDAWVLYAFSRVAEWLLLPYQPPAAHPDDAGDGLHTGAYEQFITAIGGSFPRVSDFHPFLHEIVEVQADDDPQAAPSLTALWWPGCMIGSMMLVRAGVTVRAGAEYLVPDVAAGSTLYWAWWRRHRPVADLSHGWGSNSQWRTAFRRDYRLPDRLAYNVDAALTPVGEHARDERFSTDVDLLRHRCSTLTDLGGEEWVWDQHHSEPPPSSLDSAPPMTGYLTELTTTLVDVDDSSGIWALAAARMSVDPGFVGDFVIALRQHLSAAMPAPWQYQSVYTYLLRLLCMTPGTAAVEQAVRVVTGGDLPERRHAAQLLAAHQSPADLSPVFTGPIPAAGEIEELRALVLHELILRGVAVVDLPTIAEWATSPQRSGQPFDWLPTTLTAMEGRPALPQFQLSSTSYPASLRNRRGEIVTRIVGASSPGSRETTTTETAAAISTAVAAWVSWSNGHCEARTFELTAELIDGAIADTLASFGLQCLGTRAPAELHIRRSSAGRAWQALFDAAANGGAYTSGEGGVQGRLSAWRSIAAMTGSSLPTDVTEVEDQAGGYSWYTLDPDTGWFDRTGWDIAIIAVAPDRRHVAVLAATDVD